jgi:hypothetical protein
LSGLQNRRPGPFLSGRKPSRAVVLKLKKPLLMIRMGFLIAQKPFRFDSPVCSGKGLPAFKPILNFRFVRLLYQVMI